MRLSISNIAWDVEEDASVATILQRYQVDAIDIAPSKYFPDIENTTPQVVEQVRYWWEERGIDIVGMQSLLFGTTGLNIFGDAAVQVQLLERLATLFRIGRLLGATRLVFGSPKQRDRTGLNDAEAFEQGVAFFKKAGHVAAEEGVVLCLEPHPASYGANFMTTSVETATVVCAVNHPGIQMQWDTGAMTVNAEQPDVLILGIAHIIGHIHLSEPQLATLGTLETQATDHAAMAAVLAAHLPTLPATIEMVASTQEPHIVAVERALRVAIRHYRIPNKAHTA